MASGVEVYDYKALTDELCGLYRDRAYIRGQQITGRTETLMRALEQGANITSAREQADAASAELEVSALKTEGEIACCLAKLRYLDHLYASASGGI